MMGLAFWRSVRSRLLFPSAFLVPLSALLTLVATAAFGLEAIVVRELKALGYEPRITRPGRIEFAGDFSAICRANL